MDDNVAGFILTLVIGAFLLIVINDIFVRMRHKDVRDEREHNRLMKEIRRHAEQPERWKGESSSSDKSGA